MTTRRLIETWLPIAAIGVESVRERTPMTPFPAPNRLHVWWARRPLVAARAAVLASLLPADADREKFLHAIGIHGDPVAAKARMATATRQGIRLEGNPYGYRRAFTHNPTERERMWVESELGRLGIVGGRVLDPTAGGGSIPFESLRLGLAVHANDLNPVAALVLRLTVELPQRFGRQLRPAFLGVAEEFVRRAKPRLVALFPPEATDVVVEGYLWSRTVQCPYCSGLIPLAPNWRLTPNGTGIRLRPNSKTRRCEFEVVHNAKEQSPGTLSWGDAKCPYADCERIVGADVVRGAAQADLIGEQLYAIAYKTKVVKYTKTGKKREGWERRYRAPTQGDDIGELAAGILAEKLPEWEAFGILPTERVPPQHPKWDLGRYGIRKWTQLFSPRQLVGHATSVSVLREIVDERRAAGSLDELTRAACAYLAAALDTLLNYNCRAGRWDSTIGRIRSIFDRHDFAFIWSYGEMAPALTGRGYGWAIEKTAECIDELVDALLPEAASSREGQGKLAFGGVRGPMGVRITNQSADALVEIADASLDAVVMDPPYGDNVMYAQLSDFFYVWLKRTAGLVYPELFTRQLTNKDDEAVASVVKFAGQAGAGDLAERDYQQRMSGIFAECRRVLKADGVLTVMFTHKATGAWDALASGLLEAGFTITASWPINTEAEGSLHIRDKAAANSTIFLVCRPRPEQPAGETRYWEDIEPLVAAAVRDRIASFEQAGIRGVDLYLSCFGPALEEFAKHWPLTRGQPRPAAATKKGRGRRKPDPSAPEASPYAVTPEDALDAARREVKKWKLDRLLRTNRHADIDPMTEWFILAWDAFEAPEFPYDEALRLARVVGVDLDGEIIGKLAEKKGGDLIIWDSGKRAAKSALGPPDGSRALIDVLHHAAHRARTVGLDAAREQLATTKADQLPAFAAALTALLEVLPVSSRFTKVPDEAGPVAEAATDFDVLEHLRKLAYSDKVKEPEQLEMWKEGQA